MANPTKGRGKEGAAHWHLKIRAWLPKGEPQTLGPLVSVLKTAREEGFAAVNNCQHGVECAWGMAAPNSPVSL